MFKSPFYMIAAALGAFMLVNAVATVQVMCDVAPAWIPAVAAVLAVASCAVIAAKDPTCGKVGYWYGAMIGAITVVVGICCVLQHVGPWALAIAVLCPASQWATYRRRRRNVVDIGEYRRRHSSV